MVSYRIEVSGAGPHLGGQHGDADAIARRFVRKAADAGHSIDSALITTPGATSPESQPVAVPITGYAAPFIVDIAGSGPYGDGTPEDAEVLARGLGLELRRSGHEVHSVSMQVNGGPTFTVTLAL